MKALLHAPGFFVEEWGRPLFMQDGPIVYPLEVFVPEGQWYEPCHCGSPLYLCDVVSPNWN